MTIATVSHSSITLTVKHCAEPEVKSVEFVFYADDPLICNCQYMTVHFNFIKECRRLHASVIWLKKFGLLALAILENDVKFFITA